MEILVDTSVWSLALRRKTLDSTEQDIVSELKELIFEKRVVMIGPIKQELLSGISNLNTFLKLKGKINSFEDEILITDDYIKAAEIHNICRKNGIQGSHIDFLIVAVSLNRKLVIFTTDKDFLNYSKIVQFTLHEVRHEFNNR